MIQATVKTFRKNHISSDFGDYFIKENTIQQKNNVQYSIDNKINILESDSQLNSEHSKELSGNSVAHKKIGFIKKTRIILAVAALVFFAGSAFALNLPSEVFWGSNNAEIVSAPVTNGETKRIILDAGHGGIDSGCVGISGTYEKDVNLAITKDLKAMLELAGYDVIMTRLTDDSIHDKGIEKISQQKKSDMENRKKIIDSNKDAVFISIHQNKFTSSDQSGAQIFYTLKNPSNYRLAQIIQDGFREIQTGNKREVKLFDSDLFLFKETEQPAVLIECGFLSNKNDESNLTDPKYQKQVAAVLFKAITEFTAPQTN